MIERVRKKGKNGAGRPWLEKRRKGEREKKKDDGEKKIKIYFFNSFSTFLMCQF
jgi:hypothetical protein